MTHLPFIAGSYGLFLAAAVWLAVDARLRLGRATRRLRTLDPRTRMSQAR